jgi:NAD(P)-dependent dehydrogenase (short-subunit alcohol dehydrogenase family)
MESTSPTLLITGVSTGIGLATSREMLARGWRVFGTVRKQADADRLREELGAGFTPLMLDVTDEIEAHRALAESLAPLLEGQPLQALVHNAGIAMGGPLGYLPEEVFRSMLEINVLGVYKLTQALLPLMGEGSRMVMVSSVSGRLVTPFVGGYAASKFALEAMTDAYRIELGMLGIRVISVQPGPVKTSIWQKAGGDGTRYDGTPYEELMSRQEEIINRTEAGAMPVEVVSEAIGKALTHPSPATRYLLAENAWVIRLAKWLPDRVKDRIVRRRLRTE